MFMKMYRIQMMDPVSGLFLNTNHESFGLESLKSMLTGDDFPGGTFQIVDRHYEIHFGPVFGDRDSSDPARDLAQALDVPIFDPHEVLPANTKSGVSPFGLIITLCLACFLVEKLLRRIAK